MARIKVKSLSFGDVRFRKMQNIVIPIHDRITLIAGHNGIGKSTILALIANNSGITSSQAHRSYFGKAFQANLFEIAYVDYESEYRAVRDAGLALPEPEVTYEIGRSRVVKACSLTGRSDSQKARVVARTKPREDFISEDGTISFGPDAKVPLPTLYLGMTRVLPLGESQNLIEHSEDRNMPDADKAFIASFINGVMLGNPATSEAITSNTVRGTGKLAKHPKYAHDFRCVSLGQDSLAAIATALASFNRLKREDPAYPGGLVIIDELDAGFHPHALGRLARKLQQVARQLDLQIIATTHSPRLLEAIHPDGQGDARAPDGVVYISDTQAPRIAPDQSLTGILRDMNLELPDERPTPRKKLKVYFEDEEAAELYKAVVTTADVRRLNATHNVRLEPLPLYLGCQSLIALRTHDPHFATTVAVVDADTTVRGANTDHVVKLPGGRGQNGAGLSPERTIHAFLVDLLEHRDQHQATWNKLGRKGINADWIQGHLLDGSSVATREQAKTWWRSKHDLLSQWGIIEAWVSENMQAKAAFLESFSQAIGRSAQRLATH